MANIKERIKKELIVQEGIEGKSEDIELVRKCLEIIHTSNTWQTLINVKWHRYGTKSYEMHRLYYPSQLLKNIMKLGVEQEKDREIKKQLEGGMPEDNGGHKLDTREEYRIEEHE